MGVNGVSVCIGESKVETTDQKLWSWKIGSLSPRSLSFPLNTFSSISIGVRVELHNIISNCRTLNLQF